MIRRIRDRAQALQNWGCRELTHRAQELRSVEPRDLSAADSIIESFALTTEAVRRACGKTYFDVQLLGGLALARGAIAQMQTGEGKTLTTALPVVFQGFRGKGVHVATTNAYLAQRDCAELRPALELLGLTVGLLPGKHVAQEKRRAYDCDVTFGPGYEFGFDFLRDQLAQRSRRTPKLGEHFLSLLSGRPNAGDEPLQRTPAFTVVDEADSVLIDEAVMPLVLSGQAGAPPSSRVYDLAQSVANCLAAERDYALDVPSKRIDFTNAGWQRAHAVLGEHAALPLRRPWAVYVENALRARLLLQRDVDYVACDGAVRIVDQQTGRIHDERTWRDGLHQAVEIKERVELTAETASDARITRQRYFRIYGAMAGMTGTTEGVERELKSFYNLPTVVIPTNRPCLRQTLPLRGFASGELRDQAVAAEVAAMRCQGRPVLVGTRTIRHSRTLSERLHSAGLPHVVLNGVQDEEEAVIVARAGQAGAVTIATNMAGRGTDIRLDPRAEEAGGLHVIAAEPNLSRRIDRQLSGRAARQGAAGSCRFFAACDDELFLHAPRLAAAIRARSPSGECPDDLSAEIQRIQLELETQHFELRRQLVARDEWLDGVLQTLVGTA